MITNAAGDDQHESSASAFSIMQLLLASLFLPQLLLQGTLLGKVVRLDCTGAAVQMESHNPWDPPKVNTNVALALFYHHQL